MTEADSIRSLAEAPDVEKPMPALFVGHGSPMHAIVRYEKLGPTARLAVPTNEHFLPLLYILALQNKRGAITFFADKVTLGSMSMRSVKMG